VTTSYPARIRCGDRRVRTDIDEIWPSRRSGPVARAAISTLLAMAGALFGVSWEELRDRRAPPSANARHT
jgi:hypothetical protein